MAAPTVSSTRSWAREMNSSTTHIARVRHGMSELFMRIQKDALKELPWASQQWVHFALDETQGASDAPCTKRDVPSVGGPHEA